MLAPLKEQPENYDRCIHFSINLRPFQGKGTAVPFSINVVASGFGAFANFLIITM